MLAYEYYVLLATTPTAAMVMIQALEMLDDGGIYLLFAAVVDSHAAGCFIQRLYFANRKNFDCKGNT